MHITSACSLSRSPAPDLSPICRWLQIVFLSPKTDRPMALALHSTMRVCGGPRRMVVVAAAAAPRARTSALIRKLASSNASQFSSFQGVKMLVPEAWVPIGVHAGLGGHERRRRDHTCMHIHPGGMSQDAALLTPCRYTDGVDREQHKRATKGGERRSASPTWVARLIHRIMLCAAARAHVLPGCGCT